ncbi:MAG: TetR/AcrR family transcriptional regulator [Tyzzerella sp.]|nr:TetR/AcrR family transcriptional regulator [Tyzzerella sp.]
MPKITELSKQQLKSKETKERIFQAAKRILQKNGYENLSIKNICEEAGVSNGSFYHHFKTKDDLLSYYIEDQPSMDSGLLEVPRNIEEAKNAIVGVYLNYAKYCRTLGVEFIAGYYTPHNQALNPTIRTERPYPIVTVQHYLEKAVAANAISLKLSVPEIVTDIRMLVIGNVFEWAMTNGQTDFEGNIKRSISHYLDGVFS